MKIAHAIGWYYPESLGGTEIYVAGLARRLRAAGHDLHVAAPEAGRAASADYLHEHIKVFRYPIPAVPTRAEAQGLTPVRGAEVFHRWLARLNPDVLHVHSLVTGLGLAELRVAKRLGIAVVLTHHLPSLGYVCRLGSLMERGAGPCDGIVSSSRCASCVMVSRGMPIAAAAAVSRIPPGVSAALGVIPGPIGTGLGMAASILRDARHQRELAGLADFQVVLNESGRRILIANGVPIERIVLNRLGIDHRSPRKPPVDQSPTRRPIRMGFLGRIDRTKGLRELMLAVASLPSNLPFTLEIIGPVQSSGRSDGSSFYEELQHIVAGDPRIRFKPAVASTAVPSVLAKFDVLCCPSTWFENGPTVALEAMAVGTPLIATRLGNLAEIVEDGINGRLVPPGDVEALAAAIKEITDAPARTIDVWRRALGAVRTLDEIAEDYLTLYSRLVGRREAQAS